MGSRSIFPICPCVLNSFIDDFDGVGMLLTSVI